VRKLVVGTVLTLDGVMQAPGVRTKTATAALLGTGKRLFGEGTIPLGFRLVDTHQIS
jgi:hypothetical protein